jgi:hypothetical protein
MMIAVVGSSEKVSGMRRAIPADGPMPGSTPTRLPRKVPTKR